MDQVEPKTYASRFSEQVYWIRSPRVLRDQTHGGIIGMDHGHPIRFYDNKFTTSDPEEIAFLDGILGPELTLLEPGAVVERAGPEVAAAMSTATTTAKKAQIRCPDCGRAFQAPQHLQMHAKTHEKARRLAGAPKAEGEANATPPG